MQERREQWWQHWRLRTSMLVSSSEEDCTPPGGPAASISSRVCCPWKVASGARPVPVWRGHQPAANHPESPVHLCIEIASPLSETDSHCVPPLHSSHEQPSAALVAGQSQAASPAPALSPAGAGSGSDSGGTPSANTHAGREATDNGPMGSPVALTRRDTPPLPARSARHGMA